MQNAHDLLQDYVMQVTGTKKHRQEWEIGDFESLLPISTSHYLISLPFLHHQRSDLDFGRIVMVSQGGVWWGAKPFGGCGGETINQQQQKWRVQGIYKDVVLGQPTCGHCDEFTSTLPRQTTSLYHGPVVINLPGRPASWGIARPENLFRPGGTHFISHSICSVTISLSLPLTVFTYHAI